MSRIEKKGDATELETRIAEAIQASYDSQDEQSKKLFANLKITGAKKVDFDGGSVIIVVVPYKQISLYRNAQGVLIPDLEKKLEAQVIIVGKRRALPKTPLPNRRFKAIRPYGRTLRSVNECLLDDVVFPTTIVGKRIHYDSHGKQTTHVILDQNDRTRVEEKLTGFAAAYHRLTGLNTVFEIATH